VDAVTVIRGDVARVVRVRPHRVDRVIEDDRCHPRVVINLLQRLNDLRQKVLGEEDHITVLHEAKPVVGRKLPRSVTHAEAGRYRTKGIDLLEGKDDALDLMPEEDDKLGFQPVDEITVPRGDELILDAKLCIELLLDAITRVPGYRLEILDLTHRREHLFMDKGVHGRG